MTAAREVGVRVRSVLSALFRLRNALPQCHCVLHSRECVFVCAIADLYGMYFCSEPAHADAVATCLKTHFHASMGTYLGIAGRRSSYTTQYTALSAGIIL